MQLENWCLISSLAALTQSRTFFLNGTSGFFSLSQSAKVGNFSSSQQHIKDNLYFCLAANGIRPICSHLRGGKNRSVGAPSGQSLSFLSNCCSLCASGLSADTHTRQKLGQQTTPGLLQETKQNEVMETRGLGAGLQSFLAWHNIRFVMTVNSVSTLTRVARQNKSCP